MRRLRTLLAGWLVLAMAGCSSLRADYAILSVSVDPPAVRAGDSAVLRVQVGKTQGRQQVQGTDRLTVQVSGPRSIAIRPVVLAYEVARPNGALEIVMRPGGQLPRTFQFQLSVEPGTPPGDYPLVVRLRANDRETMAEVKLRVQ